MAYEKMADVRDLRFQAMASVGCHARVWIRDHADAPVAQHGPALHPFGTWRPWVVPHRLLRGTRR